MITKELSEQVLDYIINDVEFTIRRLGINATLSVEKRENYMHDEFELLVSTSFQTMPVLFKEIHIEGGIGIKDKKGAPDDYIQVYISLRNCYTLFNGGTNGSELGRIIYEVDKKTNRKMIESGNESKYISMIVRKIQSLEI